MTAAWRRAAARDVQADGDVCLHVCRAADAGGGGAVSPDAMAPDGVAPDAVAPDAVAPDGVAPDAVAPDGVAPDAVAPDAVAPGGAFEIGTASAAGLDTGGFEIGAAAAGADTGAGVSELDRAVDAALVARERSLPGLGIILDDGRLSALVQRLPAPHRGPVCVRFLRLKSRTSALAAVEIASCDGPRTWLLAAYRGADAHKAVRDVARAHRLGLPAVLDLGSSTALVPAAADRALKPWGRRLRLPPDQSWHRLLAELPAARTRLLRYNPARRMVVQLDLSTSGAGVAKVHGEAAPGRLSVRAARTVAARVPVAEVVAVSPDDRVVVHGWVSGRVPRGSDDAVVGEVLDALHAVPPPGWLPVRDQARLLAWAGGGVEALAAVDPPLGARAAALLPRLEDALPPALECRGVLLHGDLSPDQVLVGPHGPVLLDLDRVALGPDGLDAASWEIAQVAAGASVVRPVPGGPVDPALRATAALGRLAEPWRRRLPGRTEVTRRLVEMADDALRGSR